MIPFDDSILIRIFTYLCPVDLLSVELCNRNWNQCTKQSLIWSSHLTAIWNSVEINKPSEYLLYKRVGSLSISALKVSLTRHVNCTDCIEKTDYQKTLVARLFLRGTNHPTGFPYKMTIPKWCLTMNEIKSSYYFSLREIHRHSILKSELCSIHWFFFFKQSDDEAWSCKFLQDNSFESGMHGSGMTWEFVDYDAFEGGCRIQVEQYPFLTCSRLENGEWRLENNYVYFKQIASISPEAIPLI